MALLTMGGALKRKEMISARLGDILAELYLLLLTKPHCFVDNKIRYRQNFRHAKEYFEVRTFSLREPVVS